MRKKALGESSLVAQSGSRKSKVKAAEKGILPPLFERVGETKKGRGGEGLGRLVAALELDDEVLSQTDVPAGRTE